MNQEERMKANLPYKAWLDVDDYFTPVNMANLT